MVDRRITALRARGAALPPQWAGLKFFNVYGPNEYHKGGQRSVAHQVFCRIRDGGHARLFRSHRPDYPHGGQLRDFVWVGDCVAVVEWLLETPEASGLFNVGSGKARSFADLARAVYAAMNLTPEIEFVDMPEHLREKYQYFTEAKIGRLRAAGFTRPATELEDGIASYVRDYLLSADPYV
jgi:ADP-L-glycero-D-manno-heptose 6-epimerase